MKDGEICGPLSDGDFDAVLPEIEPGTKVYKDGWKEWRKLEDVPASELPAPPPEPPRDESAAQAAGFRRRAGAFVLDFILIRFLAGQFDGGGSYWQGSYGWNYSWSQSSAADFIGLAFWLTMIYETLMVHRFGWTLGKFIFGIRVSHEGRNLTLQRSALRVLAKKLNLLTLFIGYLMALWDRDKKALHDHLCQTRVFLR